MKSVYVPVLLVLLLLISCGDSSEKQVIENSFIGIAPPTDPEWPGLVAALLGQSYSPAVAR